MLKGTCSTWVTSLKDLVKCHAGTGLLGSKTNFALKPPKGVRADTTLDRKVLLVAHCLSLFPPSIVAEWSQPGKGINEKDENKQGGQMGC